MTSSRFVGRDRELAELLEVVATSPSVAVVEGEAGVGKTRLIQELLASQELRGTPTLLGRSHPLHDPFPLGPLVEAFRGAGHLLPTTLNPVTGSLRPLLPELSEQLPPAPQPLADRQAERHRVFRGLLELLDALGAVVVVLEDLHWADRGTKEFLSFLLPQPPPGIRIVGSYRRENIDGDDPLLALPRETISAVAHVALEPLGVAGVGDLVGCLVGADRVSTAFAAHLHERTGGLPFVVEEVMRLLQDRHDVIRRDGRCERKAIDELDVPAGVRDTFLARLRRTSPEARHIVAAAAVVGRPADQHLLIDVAGLPATRGAEALAEALAAGLLQAPASGYDFRHSLARQTAYEDIEPPVRALLHRRAAEALRERPAPPVAELTEHCKRAGDAAEWVRYAEQTADTAVAVGNDAAAVPLLVEVLSFGPPDPDDRARIAVKLARCALEGRCHAEAIPSVEAVANDDTISEPRRGEVLFVLGHLLMQAGDPTDGRAAMQSALPLLRSRPDLAARAMTTIAIASVIAGRPLADVALAEQAVQLASAYDDEAERDIVVMDCSNVLLNAGNAHGWESADRLLHDPGWAGGLRQRTRGCSNYAWTAARLGHYQRAEAFMAEGVRLSTEVGYARLSDALESTGIWLDWCLGDWSGLPDRLERFLHGGPAVPLEAFTPRAVHGLLLLATEQTDEAERLLTQVLSDALERDVAEAAAAAAAGLVRLYLAGQRVPAAVDVARAVMAAVRQEGTGFSVADIAVPVVDALLAGEQTKAKDWISEAATLLDGRDAPAAHAAVANARAVLRAAEADDAAVEALQAGVEAWRGLPRPYDEAQANERLGSHLMRTGKPPTPALRAAVEAYERLGATWDATRVRRVLRETGVNLGHQRPRRGYGDRLSPREEEVARLVAQGLTSQQIGARLFLSPRTVDDHVANARRKLGASSRRELAQLIRTDADQSVTTTV